MKGAKLQLVRRFRAAPDRVFAACTDPAVMQRWFGPKEFHVTALTADVRVGGTFAFRMVGPPGEMAAEGMYQSVDPPTLLVHTWRWTEGPPEYPPDGVTSCITYEFVADGAGTRMIFTQEGLADQDEADRHTQGWSQAFDKLDALLGEAEIIVSGRITVRPGERSGFLAASRSAMEAARKAAGCRNFIVAADPLEDDRVNIYEEWESEEAMLAFRGDGPNTGMAELIVDAQVRRHAVRSGPA